MTMVTFKPEASKAKGGIGAAPTAQGEGPLPPPQLSLTHEHLKKLGLKMPAVGDKLKLHAHAMVHSTSENQDRGDGGKRAHVTLHIHQMEVGDGKQPGTSDESQKAGMKSEIDKALKRGAGGDGKNAEGAES